MWMPSGGSTAPSPPACLLAPPTPATHNTVVLGDPVASSAVNTGHFVLLPTPAAVSFAAAWHAAAPAMLKDGVTDQKALPLLEGTPFTNCSSLCRCFRANHNVSGLSRRAGACCSNTPAGSLWPCLHKVIPALGCWSELPACMPFCKLPHHRAPCHLSLTAADTARGTQQRCGLPDLPPQPLRLHPEPVHYQITKLDATRRCLRLGGCVPACQPASQPAAGVLAAQQWWLRVCACRQQAAMLAVPY